MEYVPEKFAKDFDTPNGKKLWALLTEATSIARMETASDLDQPALKSLEDILLDGMGDAILIDRMKQMAGHMVRQIMEDRGYLHDASDIRLSSEPVYKASRYRRKDREPLSIFRLSDPISMP